MSRGLMEFVQNSKQFKERKTNAWGRAVGSGEKTPVQTVAQASQ